MEYEIVETVEFRFIVNASNVDDAIAKGVLLAYSDAKSTERVEMIATKKEK